MTYSDKHCHMYLEAKRLICLTNQPLVWIMLPSIRVIYCVPESTTALLVHLGPWSHAVNRHEKHLLWLDHTKQELKSCSSDRYATSQWWPLLTWRHWRFNINLFRGLTYSWQKKLKQLYHIVTWYYHSFFFSATQHSDIVIILSNHAIKWVTCWLPESTRQHIEAFIVACIHRMTWLHRAIRASLDQCLTVPLGSTWWPRAHF